jgi:hypothetical protein
VSRYVRRIDIPFEELQKVLKCGPIHAVEVDHSRGMVKVVSSSIKGVQEGSEPPRTLFAVSETDD